MVYSCLPFLPPNHLRPCRDLVIVHWRVANEKRKNYQLCKFYINTVFSLSSPLFLSAHFANKARLLVSRHQPVFLHFEMDTEGGPVCHVLSTSVPECCLKEWKIEIGPANWAGPGWPVSLSHSDKMAHWMENPEFRACLEKEGLMKMLTGVVVL